MTGTDCGLFTHKSVPVIFEPPCIKGRWTLVDKDEHKHTRTHAHTQVR